MPSLHSAIQLIVVLFTNLCFALNCQNIQIPVGLLNIQVKDLPLSLILTNCIKEYVPTVANLLDVTLLAQRNYTIAATFCEPSQHIASRSATLQILSHGAAYNRTYWTGLGLGVKTYSWVDYAANLGYPTLAYDRLCNGDSSRPNGFMCQTPTGQAVLHQIIQQARSGQLAIGSSSRAFTKVITVGQSIGSGITSFNALTNPDDANAIVLCGWSNQLIKGFESTLYGPISLASRVYSDRYEKLGPTYLTFSSPAGQLYLSYYGDYDPSIAAYDYQTQGTFTMGEAFTALLAQTPATAYKGSVFVLDGNEDPTFCQPTLTSVFHGNPGNCSAGAAAGTASNFPAAVPFGYHITQNTGHSLHLHRTAQESFKAAHDYLAEQGF